MRPPFPGMDPWLEDPVLWPDVHNSLIAAIRDVMAPLVAPKYYIGLECRTYLLGPEDSSVIGNPDLAFLTRESSESIALAREGVGVGMVEVLVPMRDEIKETFLEVHDARGGKLVTVVEILSLAKKLSRKGRHKYLMKRTRVLGTRTGFVEIDLLRNGKPMPVIGPEILSDYRVLVSPRPRRPLARLYPFGVRDPIPVIPLPLLPGHDEPPMDLGAILHAMVERARFDLRLRYDQPPVPPLREEVALWAKAITG